MCRHAAPAMRMEAWHERVVSLVERMLELNKKKHSGKVAPSELDRIDRDIASTDAETQSRIVRELWKLIYAANRQV